MTDSERAAIRAQAFKEAAEIARAEEAKWTPYDVTDEWKVGAASAASNIAEAIEAAAAKGGQK